MGWVRNWKILWIKMGIRHFCRIRGFLAILWISLCRLLGTYRLGKVDRSAGWEFVKSDMLITLRKHKIDHHTSVKVCNSPII